MNTTKTQIDLAARYNPVAIRAVVAAAMLSPARPSPGR